MHPRSPEAHSVFRTGALLLCQPSEMVRVAGVAAWWPCASTLLGSEPGRLLLTLHPENGCQGWTRTNTVRFNKPSCYFDTTWQFEIGAAGKTRTCIGSFRRRMPLYLGHGSIGKWSARQDLHLRSLGPKPSALAATLRAGKWRIRRGSHPQPSRRQRVAPLIELRIRNGGRCW